MWLCYTYNFRCDYCLHVVEWAHRNNFLPLTFHLLKLFLLHPLSYLKGDRMMSPMKFCLIRLDAKHVTFCVSAFGRQLHFPSQPWSGRSHLSAMWGKMTPLHFCFPDCKCEVFFFIQTSFFVLSQSFNYAHSFKKVIALTESQFVWWQMFSLQFCTVNNEEHEVGSITIWIHLKNKHLFVNCHKQEQKNKLKIK